MSTDRPRVLAAGDDFVLTRLLVEAVRAEVGEEVETTGLDLPWPHTPFGDVGEGSSVVHEASGSEDELIAALDGARACVTQMAPITRRVLEACPDLELVAISRGGPVNADLVAARERGVTVTFAPGRNASATAEYTIAMMLAAMRRIPASHAGVQAGQWPSSLYAYDETGLEIEGSTVGLVGCGAIGSRVARVLSAFGAEVLVHDPYADPATLPEHSRAVELDELLSRSQVVTLHARVTEETTGILNDAALAALPDGAVVVNCARGALLDYAALAAHLRSGHLYAAGLDVFDTEPLPADHPIRSAPNVVTTPHLAGASRAVAAKAAQIVAGEVGRWHRGESPKNPAT